MGPQLKRTSLCALTRRTPLYLRLHCERAWYVIAGVFGKHPESQVRGVQLLDLRADRNFDHGQVEQVLEEALAYIDEAKGGFPELVKDHLRIVVASDSPLESASPHAQAFYTGFRVDDRRNPFYLAFRLVWAGTYIRVMRNKPWWRRGNLKRQARSIAREAQLRFIRQFPDPERWEEYLGRHGE